MKSRKLTLMQYYKLQTLIIFCQFFHECTCSGPGSNWGFHIAFSCHGSLTSSNLWQILCLFSSSTNLVLLKSIPQFWFVRCFFMIRTRFSFLVRIPQMWCCVPFSISMSSWYCYVLLLAMLTLILITWLRRCLLSFSTVKSLHFSL